MYNIRYLPCTRIYTGISLKAPKRVELREPRACTKILPSFKNAA